ncbi:hypothetical protein BD289DRAFT_254201 [Coniella lustricola]|uniref:Uncharacterized protein n=1 Tax=Coniella lustricola TaxID=2025994 RepID=A0A2T3A8B1_9PEZI|nr:hypothetical protein BD289DRAFT_254201 [Coniella lustricola]
MGRCLAVFIELRRRICAVCWLVALYRRSKCRRKSTKRGNEAQKERQRPNKVQCDLPSSPQSSARLIRLSLLLLSRHGDSLQSAQMGEVIGASKEICPPELLPRLA